jgi:hypothetical protein
MTLPQKFPTPSPSAIASYDHTDIASGTGHVTFYGGSANLSTGYERFLIQQALYGSEGIPMNATTTLDLSAFNFPKIIKGTAYVTFFVNKSTATAQTITMKFQKVSDTTTDICSAVATASLVNTGYINHTLIFSMTETHFKRGDILRLHIVITASDGSFALPLNPIGAYPFILSIPFKIDI